MGGPKGVGTAVALLWGVAVQLVAEAATGVVTPWPAGVGAAAALVVGEAVRSGARWSRLPTVALGAGLTIAGIVGLRDPGGWNAAPTVILLTAAPWLAVRLALPVTRDWFRTTSAAEARRRHDARWSVGIALVAVAFGLLVAYAESR